MTGIVSKLLHGIARFSNGYCYPNSTYNQAVKAGQSPKVMIIGCSDSLVDPAILTGAQPGELFVHRNIAALVPSFHESMSSIQPFLAYGIFNLKVRHIIVLGHGHCGGIKALFDNNFSDPSGAIRPWLKTAQVAKEAILKKYPHLPLLEKRRLCEQKCVEIGLQNLKSHPWIDERVQNKELALHGWHFEMGILSKYNAQTGLFESVDFRLRKDTEEENES